MIRLVAVAVFLVLFGMVGAARAQGFFELDLNSFYEWELAQDDTARFSHGDVRMTVRYLPEDQWPESGESLELTLYRKGQASVTFGFPGGMFAAFGAVSVHELDPAGPPSLLFQTYTGGAHCCAAVFAIDLKDLSATELGWFDGAMVEPVDLDADGYYELAVSDNRFLYTFDAYAFSYPPAMIVSLRNGGYAELTAEPAFRRYLEDDFSSLKSACFGVNELGDKPYSRDEGLNSACASAIAVSAWLGRFDETVDEISRVRKLRPGADFDFEEFHIYPDGGGEPAVFTDLVAAAQYAARAWGYLD